MRDINITFNKKTETLWRLLIIILPLFLVLILFNLSNVYIIISLAVLSLIYVFFRKYLWVFMILATPALTFGQFINFEIRPNWIYEISIAEIFIFAAAIIFLLDKFLNKKTKEIKTDYLFSFLLIYLFISLASVWQVIDFQLYVAGLKIIVLSFLSYFLALNILNNRDKIKWFLYGLTITAVILSSQIFVKFYQMGFSKEFFFNRSIITVPVGAIALVAAILAMMLTIILAFYFYLNHENKIKPFVLLGFILGWLAVFLTLGKGAILSLLIGMGYLFYKLKNKRIAFILFLCLFIILSYILFTPFFAGLYERMINAFVDQNTEFRILEYQTCWKIIKDNVWLGVGTGQQLLYYQKMLYPDYGQWINNFFLQSLVDLGIIGFTVLLLIIAAIFRKIKNNLQNNKKSIIIFGFIASIIIAFLNGLVEVTFFALPYAIIFWLIIGVFSNLKVYEKINSHNH